MNFEIVEIKDRAKKIGIMRECDDAYTISVVERPFFPELFEKIDKYAVFLAVIGEEGTIAGYSAFYANDEIAHKAFLSLFCIKRDMQRMHLGERLIKASLETARLRGMYEMELEVLRVDNHAIKFYEQYGFELTGKQTDRFLTMKREL